MFTQLFRGRFFNHLLGSDLILIIVMIAYNLVTFFVPLVKLRLGNFLLFLVIINVILIALKLTTIHLNQQP